MGACEIKIVGIAHHSPGDNIVYMGEDGELHDAKVYSIVIDQAQPHYFNLYYNIAKDKFKPIPANKVWSNRKEYEGHLRYMKLMESAK